MELCFVDVAQGSASVILLGGGRAIVIDCGGMQARTVISLLNRFRVSTITRLIVTHNHADHSGGAVALLTAYQNRVDEIWMVYDTVLDHSVFWQRIDEDVTAGRLTEEQIFRLEYRNGPTEIYRGEGMLLAAVAPSMIGNLRAVRDANPNATSGVLVLKRDGRQVVFSGDSTIPEWQAIRQRLGRPIKCLLLTVPHHAGKVWEEQRPGETDADFTARVRAELDWLYTDAVNAEVGVVSVGTSNSYRHPRPEVLDAFRRSGGTVFCTQMTSRCDRDLETQRRRALPLLLPSRSSTATQRTGRGVSKNVACGGTLVVEFVAGVVTILRLAEHQAAVSRVPHVAGQRPLCRR